jgi:hypothetical protein
MEDEGIGCVIEVKYAERKELDNACQKALEQINNLDYTEKLRDDGMTVIYKYGIACFKKQCKVVCIRV